MIRAFLSYLMHSTNEHGVHSPFVFEMLTKCFYDKKKYDAYKTIKTYKKTLTKNKTIINITDFGAGSHVFKTNQRQVKALAKHVGISKKRGELLYRLCKHYNVKKALEFGTSLGLGTCSLALGSQHVTTVEGCPETAKIAQQYFKKFKLNNIQLIQDNFEKVINQLKTKFDLIYIDGNHQELATLHYFEQLIPLSHNDTLFIFDDIHWSKGMENAWQTIYNDKRVTVSIDTFQWGIVSLRKEQQKEHFVIRF